jgi:hypothetical protein
MIARPTRPEHMDELIVLAKPLYERAFQITTETVHLSPGDATDEELKVVHHCSAATLAMQALLCGAPLNAFLAASVLGGTLGTIIGQLPGEQHELYSAFRYQLGIALAAIDDAMKPMGNA